VRANPGSYQKKVLFGTSGSDCVDGALKLAWWATNRPYILCVAGAYHGQTRGALSASSAFGRLVRGFHPAGELLKIPPPYCYRCPFRLQYPACGVFGRTGEWFALEANALGCAAALATIRVLEQEKLLDNCRNLGTYLMQRLERMKEIHPLIGDVRGKDFSARWKLSEIGRPGNQPEQQRSGFAPVPWRTVYTRW
jgi:4-aminobutyrate aminotransferase-like enzyme